MPSTKGVGAWATMDAGPNVKVLCAARDLPRVQLALATAAGGSSRRVLAARPGPGLRTEVLP